MIVTKKNENSVTFKKDNENQDKKIKKLRYHQRQLYHFLDLYYNTEKYSDSERAYYQEYTDNTYRKHLKQVHKLQEELNQFDSQAIF